MADGGQHPSERRSEAHRGQCDTASGSAAPLIAGAMPVLTRPSLVKRIQVAPCGSVGTPVAPGTVRKALTPSRESSWPLDRPRERSSLVPSAWTPPALCPQQKVPARHSQHLKPSAVAAIRGEAGGETHHDANGRHLLPFPSRRPPRSCGPG